MLTYDCWHFPHSSLCRLIFPVYVVPAKCANFPTIGTRFAAYFDDRNCVTVIALYRIACNFHGLFDLVLRDS